MNGEHVIKNRQGKTISLLVEEASNARGLVFVMHGFAGFKEQKHIRAFAEAFAAENFTVVSFDATNASGESDGETKDATMHSYVHDLEDVIVWAKTQSWFQTPFALCGHSMGAQSVAWYASQHLEEVSLLLPMAPMVNYDLRTAVIADAQKEVITRKGFIELPSKSKPGIVSVFTLENHESLRQYNLLSIASDISIPVLDIVGEQDQPCPVKHQKLFIDSLASKDKQLQIIPRVDHNYRAQDIDYRETLETLNTIIRGWLSKHA